MICASAPALKVFFRRYFSTSTSSGGGYGSKMTPIPLSRSRGLGASQPSSHSASVSRVEPSDRHSSVPFTGIKVSQGLDILVEDRDDQSQKSFASTRELTALPKSEEKGFSDWTQSYRNVRAAFKTGSQNDSRTRNVDKDIERG